MADEESSQVFGTTFLGHSFLTTQIVKTYKTPEEAVHVPCICARR